jgi:hypothetical protein
MTDSSTLTNEDLVWKQTLRRRVQGWFDNRLVVAERVLAMSDGQQLNTDFDAQILICCALSAVAAKVWPGKGIDRARFTELLVRYCDVQPQPTTISIPALIRKLAGKQEQAEVRRYFWQVQPCAVVNAASVDQDESAVRAKVPGLSLRDVRAASYAAILYEDLRSGLVHEYDLQSNLMDWSFSPRQELIYQYRNSEHSLFMPMDYLPSVARSAATAAFDAWEKRSAWKQELPRPTRWWIDG